MLGATIRWRTEPLLERVPVVLGSLLQVSLRAVGRDPGHHSRL